METSQWSPNQIIEVLERRKSTLLNELTYTSAALESLRKAQGTTVITSEEVFATAKGGWREKVREGREMIESKQERGQRQYATDARTSEVRTRLLRAIPRGANISTNEVIENLQRAGFKRDRRESQKNFKAKIYGQLETLARRGFLAKSRPGTMVEGAFWKQV